MYKRPIVFANKLKVPTKFRVKSGFTLAEVLITLGLIGNVALLVLPGLITNVEKHSSYAGLQKAYSVISQRASRIRADNSSSMAGVATDSLAMANLFKEEMKFTQFCEGEDDSEKCYVKNTDPIRNLSGGNYANLTNIFGGFPKILAADGTVFMFGLHTTGCNSSLYQRNGVQEGCLTVFADVNGLKRPNMMGKDIFGFSVNKYNVTPYVNMSDTPSADINAASFKCSLPNASTSNGVDCSYRAIQEGGIYYY